MMFIYTSIIIFIDTVILHNPFTFLEGSFLHQVIYGLWIFSFISIPVKAYNEFCDKKDAEKAEKEKLKKEQEELEKKKQQELEQEEKECLETQKIVNKYFEMFDYCDEEERNILFEFYSENKCSINISDNEKYVIKGMQLKGIQMISYSSNPNTFENKAITNTTGLKIIQKYFDRDKKNKKSKKK